MDTNRTSHISSIDAERAVLGSLMLAPTLWAQAQGAIRADDFFDPGHRAIFRAMERLEDQQIGIDPTTVADALQRKGQLELAGGQVALLQLEAYVLATANFPSHCRVVRNRAETRRVLAELDQTADAIRREGDHTDALPGLERNLAAIRQRAAAADGPSHIRDLAIDVVMRSTSKRSKTRWRSSLPPRIPVALSARTGS